MTRRSTAAFAAFTAITLLAAPLCRAAPAPATAAAPADATALAELHATIKPQPGESKWATVPWLDNLQAGRERALREDKALFIWRAGGGEVLGRA